MLRYRRMQAVDFFRLINSERRARQWFWRAKYEGRHTFECPRCTHRGYWEHRSRPEIRTCRLCHRQVRLRAGTILEHSKLPLLTWARAIFLVTQDTRGVSARQLKRQLGLCSNDTSWRLLHRIREALRQRDERYTLSGVVELDGADLGEQKDRGAGEILLAVESKQWVDSRGRRKKRAGFAKVVMSRETSIFAQQFVDAHIRPESWVNTDGSAAYAQLKGVHADSQVMHGAPDKLEHWLPWVFYWVQNAKAWLRATFHGVKTKYLRLYLAEHNYRFNRRHDPDSLFHRALSACALAKPVRAAALLA